MFNRRQFIASSAALAWLLGSRQAVGARQELRLGTLPVVSTRTAYQIYQPLIEHLERTLGLAVKLETPPNFRAMYQRVGEGAFDLLVSPPHIARLAQKRLGWQPLVVCQPEHHAVLLAMAKDGPAGLEGLRGGNVAVLDSSALATMVLVDAMAQKGLVAGRDFKLMETRSYESSLLAVKQGVAQAMVARSQGFFEREGMKELFQGGTLPGYVFLAAPSVPAALRHRLQSQLLAFALRREAAAFLDKLGYERMSPATEPAMQRLDPYLDATEQKLK